MELLIERLSFDVDHSRQIIGILRCRQPVPASSSLPALTSRYRKATRWSVAQLRAARQINSGGANRLMIIQRQVYRLHQIDHYRVGLVALLERRKAFGCIGVIERAKNILTFVFGTFFK